MHIRKEIVNIAEELEELLHALIAVMEENMDTYMPGFTHLQKAQPITLAHHMGAYFEMFHRACRISIVNLHKTIFIGVP